MHKSKVSLEVLMPHNLDVRKAKGLSLIKSLAFTEAPKKTRK